MPKAPKPIKLRDDESEPLHLKTTAISERISRIMSYKSGNKKAVPRKSRDR